MESQRFVIRISMSKRIALAQLIISIDNQGLEMLDSMHDLHYRRCNLLSMQNQYFIDKMACFMFAVPVDFMAKLYNICFLANESCLSINKSIIQAIN